MSETSGFQWRGKTVKSYGEIGSALCGLSTSQDAVEFWEAYVGYLARPDAELLGKSPEEVASSNVGYLMGYYGNEERERVYRLFPQAVHPVFGADFGRGAPNPTPEEAFDAGAMKVMGVAPREVPR